MATPERKKTMTLDPVTAGRRLWWRTSEESFDGFLSAVAEAHRVGLEEIVVHKLTARLQPECARRWQAHLTALRRVGVKVWIVFGKVAADE